MRDRTHTIIFQGSIHTTMATGNLVELVYTEYLMWRNTYTACKQCVSFPDVQTLPYNYNTGDIDTYLSANCSNTYLVKELYIHTYVSANWREHIHTY